LFPERIVKDAEMADISLRCQSNNSEVSRVCDHCKKIKQENPLLIILAMVSRGFLFFQD
jgi:hypothetical protein